MRPSRALARVGARTLFVAVVTLGAAACAERVDTLSISGSVVGAEGEILRRQVARFTRDTGVAVDVRPTPDAADQRHQLYVQWLNAWAADPDILQLDATWTAEFAAAGWIMPAEGVTTEDEQDFFTATLGVNTWQGVLYATPWFVDVGMLYWRTDLMASAPDTFEALEAIARRAIAQGDVASGFVWQGARYEGLVTVFLEHLVGFGGRILDERGRVALDSAPAVAALTFMRDAIHSRGFVPAAVLSWQEEQSRFAFQNGRAAFMRNWPYAAALLSRPSESSVAGRFAVAPMPRAAGRSAATLGGAQLAVNARTRQRADAWRLVEFLTAPAQMIERAEVAGQFPARQSVYDDPRLAAALPVPASVAKDIVSRAVSRPVTPVYTQLSDLLQVHLHRALSRQETPEVAIASAATAIQLLLDETDLAREVAP